MQYIIVALGGFYGIGISLIDKNSVSYVQIVVIEDLQKCYDDFVNLYSSKGTKCIDLLSSRELLFFIAFAGKQMMRVDY